MNLDEFAQQVQDMHQRVTQIQQHAGESLSQQQHLEIVTTAFQELSTALEELQAANDELNASNEELSAVHQAVEAERQRYQELFEFAPDAYLVTDTAGVIQEANRAASTLFNISQTFLVSKPLDIYVVKNKRLAFHSKLTELCQVDGVQEWEVNLQPRNKTSITVAARVIAVRNQQGRAVRLRWLLRDITEERNRTELELQRLNERFQLAATAVKCLIYDWDIKTRTVDRTQGLFEVLGYRPEEAEPTPDWWSERIHPDDRQHVRKEMSDALANRSQYTIEYRIRHKNDRYLYLWERGLIVRNATGQAVRVVGSDFDISDRKQAEEALQTLNQELESRVRERTTKLEQLNELLIVEIDLRAKAEAALRQREQEFRALVENAPDIIERFDRELRHVYVNPAVEKVTGRLPSEFIGKTNHELGTLEPNLSLWEGVLRKIFQSGQEDQIEFSTVTPNGRKYYQTRFVPEFAADGNPVSVLGISRDITDHKLALEALQESEERFRQIAENIHEVFWMISLDRPESIYVSPAYEEIWGKSCESLYEDHLSWLDAVHPEDRDRLSAILKTVAKGEYNAEYRIVRPDGSIRWIRDRGFPVLDAQGKPYRRAGIAEDITCLKQAELEISKTLQTERELGELKSRFISMTSHEFRTPLTTIQSSAQMLERYRNRLPEEKQLTHLNRIQTAVERMTQMLNDVLIIGKAESGKLEFQPTRIDLVQFCRELVEELQQGVGKQHAIAFASQCPCFSGNIDEKLLRHILSNLLTNAIKYSPGSSTVHFDLTCLDGNAVFQIQDQGIGIPPEDLPRLFETFHRATNVGAIQGTGLGLAIVKQCVELHKGEITVKSEVGKGTTFTVRLPLSN